MYFYYEQTIPKNTAAILPVLLTCHVAVGLFDFIDIGIPDKVNRLASCKVFYNQFQLLPFNRARWFTGNNVTIRIPIDLELDANLSDIEIYAMNIDDTFPHTLSYGIAIKSAISNTLAALAETQGLLQVPSEIT